jgi:Leucine rich repeat
MFRHILLLLLSFTTQLAFASPGDSLRVQYCTAEEFEKICENASLKFLAIGYYYSDTLPACIANLTQLEELDICWDGYRLPIRKATVLPAIGKLTKLKSLTFSGGYLPIELPSEIGNLTCLKRLRIYNLKFDSLPESFGNLVNLEDAMLCGDMKSLPNSISNWKKIKSIYLAGNMFEKIPECLFNIPSLQSLDLSRNDLLEIDPRIAELSELEELNFEGNTLLRTLPDALCQLQKLRELEVENTLISALPECLTNNEALEKIQMCDFLIENPTSYNEKFNNKIKWVNFCVVSNVVDTHEAYGEYSAYFTNEKDSIAYHVNYVFNFPGMIDEEYWREVIVKVPKDIEFRKNKVYPLTNSYFDLKYTTYSVWDWNSEKRPNVSGYIIFREINRRSAKIYMRIILNENQEEEIVIDRKLKFRKQ